MHKLGFSHVFAKLAIALSATGRLTINYKSPVTALQIKEKVAITAAGPSAEFDKVISTIDGLNLQKIVANSEIADKEALLESLGVCRYKHVAICNLIYDGDLAAAMKAAMPEKFQHIYVAGNSTLPKGSYGIMQAMNMSNFVPNQSCLPADQVHINVQVELNDD